MNSSVLNMVNELITGAIPGLKALQINEFGPAFVDSSTTPADLAIYRFSKKWYVPSAEGQKARSERTIDQWLEREDEISGFIFNPDRDSRWVLMRASMLLHKWLRGFKPVTDVEYTSGESFISSKGHTSLRQKLKNPDHWTVTYEAADKAAEMVWSTRALRNTAWRHLETLAYAEISEALWCGRSEKEIFVRGIKTYLFKCVVGARLALVPKDNEIDRAINVEPTLNMLLQRQVGLGLRGVLSGLGNDLETGQIQHKRKISLSRWATVDFSSASDSHILACFLEMFPSHFTDYVCTIRSFITVIKSRQLEVPNFKLASMGNGFTFEVMTMLILSVARVFDPEATVYGDDVIISNEYAVDFMTAMEALGWTINKKKSFVNSPFRESCGGFYDDRFGYLVSYDFHYCETMADVCCVANKLRLLIRALQMPFPMVANKFAELRDDILAVVPASLKGPVIDVLSPCGISLEVNPRWVEYEKYERSHRASESCRDSWNKSAFIRAYHDDRYSDPVVAVVNAVSMESELIHTVSDVCDPWNMYSAISGSIQDRNRTVLREKNELLFITRDSNVVSLSLLSREYREIRESYRKWYGSPPVIGKRKRSTVHSSTIV